MQSALAMKDPLKHRNVLSLADLGPRDVAYLLGLARRLKDAREAGSEEQLLRGRIVGVLGGDTPDAAFVAALAEQGARLAAIPAGLAPAGEPERLRRAAQLLGRMYDAVDCPDCDAATLAALAKHCSVPVFGGLSTPRQALHALGHLLTLQALSCAPLGALRIAWRGDPDDPAAAGLQQAAALAGVAFGEAADGTAPDFVFEPRNGGAMVAGCPDAANNRLHTIKALLVSTLA
jgi:ornithine carbamoyltransferase